jgi:hypothetical protein
VFDYPEDNLRVRDLEIKGEEEYNAELRVKGANFEDAPFDVKKGPIKGEFQK